MQLSDLKLTVIDQHKYLPMETTSVIPLNGSSVLEEIGEEELFTVNINGMLDDNLNEEFLTSHGDKLYFKIPSGTPSYIPVNFVSLQEVNTQETSYQLKVKVDSERQILH